jgi:myo-inositol-1(or 4)-monophosphatase
MVSGLSEALLAEIEDQALDMARGAGDILRRFFGTRLAVEYKDERQSDPVTVADRESQEYLVKRISESFPEHGIVGEEDEDKKDSVAPDFVWVVDPLDGTKNFLSGLPLYACSIGVLYRGAPIAGAIYIPWPGEFGGIVLHARKGGGAYADQERISVVEADTPAANRLTALPGSFGGAYRISGRMRGRAGELRVTGSIAYELAMTATGVLQYAVTTGGKLWDVAGGASILVEAGGAVLVGRSAISRTPLGGKRLDWEELASFHPSWRSGTTTLDELRRWSAPLIVGSPGVARAVAQNLRRRRRPWRRIGRTLRRLKGRAASG